MNVEILTGMQARKKYTLAQLKNRHAVILTRWGGRDELKLGTGPIVEGRDDEIAFFVDLGNGDLLGVFDNEQFALLPELSTGSVDNCGGGV